MMYGEEGGQRLREDMQPLLLLEVAHMMYGGEGGQRLREGMQTLPLHLTLPKSDGTPLLPPYQPLVLSQLVSGLRPGWWE